MEGRGGGKPGNGRTDWLRFEGLDGEIWPEEMVMEDGCLMRRFYNIFILRYVNNVIDN